MEIIAEIGQNFNGDMKLAEKLIDLQSSITLENNIEKINSLQYVLIEKESKKSKNYWSGRTDGNTWTIVKKKGENIKEIIPVKINDARGVTLFGESLTKKELLYETN